MMKQLGRKWGAAAVLSLLAAPALTLTAAVRSDFDTRAAFSDYRTFAWRAADNGGGSDGQQLSLVDSRVRANAAAELARRGLREDAASPDVILSYRVESGIERTATVMPSPWGLYGGAGIWPRPLYRPMYRPHRPMMQRPRGFGFGYYGPGFGYGMGPRVVESEYAAGRVVLDMVDARTNQVIWQAEVTRTGNSLMDVQSEKSIAKAMKDAFKKFPRKAS